MKNRNKKMIAVGAVGLLILAAILAYSIFESPASSVTEADIGNLLRSRSVRREVAYDAVVAPYTDPFAALIATPLGVYHDNNNTKTVRPLLLAGSNTETPERGISKGVVDFLSAYSPQRVVVVGAVDDSVRDDLGVVDKLSLPWSDHTALSEEVARRFWESSDGVLLIEGSQRGYDPGVNAVPLASYLNIPVIVTSDTDTVKDTLRILNVKYTLVCGDLEGYKRTMFFSNISQVQNVLAVGMPDEGEGEEGKPRSVLGDRVGIEKVDYIAVANPLDIDEPEVLDEVTETFKGTVTSRATGSTSDPSASSDAPTHYFDIPEDYTWANVVLDSKVKYSDSAIPGRTPEADGQRSYAYFGIDMDEDGEMISDPDSEEDHLQFFAPSLGYEGTSSSMHSYTEKPIFRSTGKHAVQLLATLHYQPNPVAPPPETGYTLTVKAQKLSGPNYPLAPGLSCLAPYLAAARDGMVLAHPDFSVHSDALLSKPDCGDPAQDPELAKLANGEAYEVKEYLNELLGRLRGVPASRPGDYPELAKIYAGDDLDPLLVAIVSDTNMVPQYHYASEPQQEHYGSREGYGIASDNIYADVDAGLEDCFSDLDGSPVSMELGVGRLMGWDAQDVSALIARTLFYEDINRDRTGHSGQPFGRTAMTTFGTQIPVGFSETVTTKLDKIFEHGEYVVDSKHDGPASDSKISHPVYERSNLIYFCAHGFYYWFIPPGYKETSVGGGFYPANVNKMSFGPSSVFASSCVTGKLDGLHPTNAVSLSFLHSGMNLYLGATRLSWGGFSPLSTESGEILGAYLGMYTYGYLMGEIYQRSFDAFKEVTPVDSFGAALMKAKNAYIEEMGLGGESQGNPHTDTVAEFNIIGDPAFIPYIPARA